MLLDGRNVDRVSTMISILQCHRKGLPPYRRARLSLFLTLGKEAKALWPHFQVGYYDARNHLRWNTSSIIIDIAENDLLSVERPRLMSGALRIVPHLRCDLFSNLCAYQ